MNTDQPPPLPSRSSPEKKGKIAVIAVFWAFVAVAWFAMQFLLSEALYRISDSVYSSNEELGDWLTGASDRIAWPAGVIYDKEVFKKAEAGYERALADPEVEASVKETLQSTMDTHGEEIDDYEVIDEIVVALGDYPEYEGIDYLSSSAEYTIYAGVCLLWGLAVGAIGFTCSILAVK